MTDTDKINKRTSQMKKTVLLISLCGFYLLLTSCRPAANQQAAQ